METLSKYIIRKARTILYWIRPVPSLTSCNSAYTNSCYHKTNNSTTKTITKTSPKDYPIYKLFYFHWSGPAKLCLSLTRFLLALAPIRKSKVLQDSSQFTIWFLKKLINSTFTTLGFFLASAWGHQIDLGMQCVPSVSP